MQNFALYKTPPFLTKEDLNELITRANRIDGIYIPSIDKPIQVADSLSYNFNEKISCFFTSHYSIEVVKAMRELKFLFSLPDELISFKNVNYSAFTCFQKLAEISCTKQWRSIDDILEIIFPIFMRSDFNSFYQQNSIKVFIDSIKQQTGTFDFTHYISAIEVRICTWKLKENLKKKEYFSTILKVQNNLIQTISTKSNPQLYIPFITTELCPVLYDIMKLCFSSNYQNDAEKVSLLTYLQESLLTIASVYPPALMTINWQKMIGFFSTLQTPKKITPDLFPSFDYVLKFSETCSLPFFGENISALMLSTVYMKKLESEQNRDMYLKLLHSVCTTSRVGQMSVTQGLFIISQYPIFKKAFEAIIELIEMKDFLIAQLLVDVFDNNFSPVLFKVFQNFKLKEKLQCSGFVPELQKSLSFILRLGTPDLTFSNDNFISKVRSVDSFIVFDTVDSLKLLSENPSFFLLTQDLINDTIKEGKMITDLKCSIPFVHLCSSFMKICTNLSKGQKIMTTHPNLSVEFILTMFNGMCQAFYPTPGSVYKDMISFRADFLMELNRFVQTMHDFSNDFFVIAFQYVEHVHPTFDFSTIVLFKMCYAHGMTITYSEIVTGKKKTPATYCFALLKTDNQLIYDTVLDCTISLMQGISKFRSEILDLLLPSIQSIHAKLKKKDLEGGILLVRLMNVLCQITKNPQIKFYILQHSDDRFQSILKTVFPILTEVCSVDDQVPYFAVKVLINLLCKPYSDGETGTDYYQPNEDQSKQILFKIISILSNGKQMPENEEYSLALMQLFAYLTDNPFYIDLLLKKIERKMTIIYENAVVSLDEKYNEFMEAAMKAMINVGHYDIDYANTIIQRDSDNNDQMSSLSRYPEFKNLLDQRRNKPLNVVPFRKNTKMKKPNETIIPPAANVTKTVEHIYKRFFYNTLYVKSDPVPSE